MRKPKTIQIKLPEPCHEDWDEMTPVERGRFCTHCQKTVIDFTKWTDTDLFNFFIKDKGKTCGRFTNLQLDRNLTVPTPQPGFIYRIAITLGLTSLLTHIPTSAFAQHTVHQHSLHSKKQSKPLPKMISGIKGLTTDQYGKTIPMVQIDVYDDKANLVASVRSDESGCYQIDDLATCTYKLVASHPNKYLSKATQNIIVNPGEYASINLLLRRPEIEPRIVTTGGAPITMTIADYIHPRHYWLKHPWKFIKRKIFK